MRDTWTGLSPTQSERHALNERWVVCQLSSNGAMKDIALSLVTPGGEGMPNIIGWTVENGHQSHVLIDRDGKVETGCGEHHHGVDTRKEAQDPCVRCWQVEQQILCGGKQADRT